MAYTNKVSAAAATAMLFLAFTFAPPSTEAQLTPNVDPVCILVTNIVDSCYLKLNLVPSDECCNNLKSASNRQVTCLCDNFIAHPSNANLTRALYDEVNTVCGVLDKFACKGNANGGATNKIVASMGLFGLVASIFF